MEKKKSAWKTALLASGSFAGYNIGSGFATGTEGQQFFASWGAPNAFIGVLVAMVTTALIFIPVYLVGYRKKADASYNVYHYYCGSKVGKIIDTYVYIGMLLVILIMMSGAGATINQYFGIPKAVGAILLGVLCIGATLLGLEKLMHVLSYAGVVIVAFVLCCTAYIRFSKGITLSIPTATIEAYVAAGELKQISLFGLSGPVFCGIINAGLLVYASLPWVASTGSLCENRKTAIWSGALSGVIFYAAQTIVVYLSLISIDKIAGAEVPVLAVFQSYLPAVAMIYSVFIIVAIFSTVSGRLFVFASHFDKGNRKRHILITSAVVVFSAVGGTFIPYSALSKFEFTLHGCLGLSLGLTILVRTVIDRKKLPKEPTPQIPAD